LSGRGRLKRRGMIQVRGEKETEMGEMEVGRIIKQL
jgi:hypothetical protein